MKSGPDFIGSFASSGIHFLPRFDPEGCTRIFDRILQFGDFGIPMFLSEEEYNRAPSHFGVNPAPGSNRVERLADELAFIDNDRETAEKLETLLGKNYQIFSKKLVCAVPRAWIPQWLIGRLLENPTNCLNAYLRPAYRDITYLFSSDFHMDVVDRFKWPDGTPRKKFITMYVNLCEVTKSGAPLIVMPGSHRFGATVFPHELEMKDPDTWTYSDGRGRRMECRHAFLTGGAGTSAMWHACLLHGAPMNPSDKPRISLRYIVSGQNDETPCGLDEVNRSLEGPLFLGDWEYRTDLDSKGVPKLKRPSAIGQIRLT